MSDPSSSNFVLHAKSDQFYWEGTGQLSIKTFTNGRAYYKTHRGYFAVEKARYLLLNEGPYAITIDEEHEVESFCIFFRDGFAEDVHSSLQAAPDKLLADPFHHSRTVGFFEKTYHLNPTLSRLLQQLKNGYSTQDALWKEEQFYKIMRALLNVHHDVLKDVQSLKAVRYSTREEIYRRISLAHEYIQAFYARPIMLRDIAQAAGLSPNHLLRCYAEIYGKTPHEHITELRIAKAKQRLSQPDCRLIDIAFEIGLNHPASFSKLFKQHVGLSPMQFRKKVILEKK